MMSKSNYKKIFLFLTLLAAIVGFVNFAPAQAVDVYGGQKSAIGSGLGLGSGDPRVIAANVIRVALGFIGIVAVSLVIYAGWMWMTAAGNSDKIEKAKKILIGAVIGLIIALASFAIATFVIDKLQAATGSGSGSGGGGGGVGGGGGCTDGATKNCGCNNGGTSICTGGVWGSCSIGACGTSNLGDSCNGTTTPGVCDPQQSKCNADLVCDSTGCVCTGAPIIDWLSPVDTNGTPNGAPGNFITIGGRYFGTTTGDVYFTGASGLTDQLASFPSSVNANCGNTWQDNQIIVVVPAGAKTGPVRVVRKPDGQEDTTDNNRGAKVPISDGKFEVNSIVRPGLCLVNPSNGKLNDAFTLQGIRLNGATSSVLFGNASSSIPANSTSNWTNTSVNATVPNLQAGGKTLFVRSSGQNSNALNFTINLDITNLPVIDYLDPASGPVGQYVTIYGSKFGSFKSGVSRVLFHNPISGATSTADIDFPAECKQWWHDTYIVVKVPKKDSMGGNVNVGSWEVLVTNGAEQTSAPANFDVTAGQAGPGLCALIPHNGQVGASINAYGDNFGDTQGTGRTIFYDNQDGSVLAGNWHNKSIKTAVPGAAGTGPFKVAVSSNSNSLNFTVGSCTADSECDTLAGEKCCAGGALDGICSTDCAVGAPAASCTYAWTFSTGSSTPPAFCSGYSTANQCLAAGSCPNSPGQCSTKSGSTQTDCSLAKLFPGKTLNYMASIDKYASTTMKCSIDEDANLNVAGLTVSLASLNAVCNKVGSGYFWQIGTTNNICPNANTVLDINSKCTVAVTNVFGKTEKASCDPCGSDLSYACVADGVKDNVGVCAVNQDVCPGSATCDTNIGKCSDTSTVNSCECCCEIPKNDPVTKNNPGCCLGLTCAGTCGIDTNPNGPTVISGSSYDFGQCTGCTVRVGGVVDQTASDSSCNCTGISGKYCDTAAAGGLGACKDQLPTGASCSSNPNTCVPTNNCQPGLACDPVSCVCKPEATTSTPLACDSDTTTPQCNPSNALCPQGQTCNNSSCTCESSSSAGEQCTLQNVCTDGVNTCATDYKCLTDPNAPECRCCCDPAGPANGAGLKCVADQSPCSGGSRGLFCGCKADQECGNSNDGCGNDTCCRPRPKIISVAPVLAETNVCRNPLVKITFDQAMDVSSFSGNVVMVGDYGTDPCPSDSAYLTTIQGISDSSLARAWNWLKTLFGGNANAMPGNFCAVNGVVSGYNVGTSTGIMTFSPQQVLDPARRYYVIIKGDGNTTDNVIEGVKSSFKVAMADNWLDLNNDGSVNDNDRSFNSLKFYGYGWYFTTKPKTSTDNGICKLDYVRIDPDNKLFQKANDTAPFFAYAKTSTGEDIVPVPTVYDWQWSWLSDNPTIASVGATAVPTTVNVTSQNKRDAKTYLRATAKITVDKVNNPSTKDQSKTAKASIRLFLCDNPWPPVSANWPWQDSNANCTINENGDCPNNNFEFYYCRDKGKSGVDDLPSINNTNPVIRGKYNDLLKEFYFLRPTQPGVTSLSAYDQLTGGKLFIIWPPVPGAAGYKLFYGQSSKNYGSSIDVGSSNSTIVANLTNNNKYYFAIKSYDNNHVESDLSNEVSAIPTDQWPPEVPGNFTATAATSSVNLKWDPSADAVKYKVYYGTTQTAGGVNGGSQEVGNATAATLNGLASGVTYYFMVGAFDNYNNQATTTVVSATPN